MSKKKNTFAEWIKTFGVDTLSAICGVTPRTVYYWIEGRVKPSDKNSEIILGLAPNLTLSDIKGIR